MIGWGVCVLALALADRYLLKRKDITHLELGDVEIKPGFIRVPFKYRSKFPFLRGATVRYWIRDVQKPTTVIEGEQRCLTSAEQGENSEWLYIPTEYMGKESDCGISTSWLRMATRSLTRCIGFSLLLSKSAEVT